jgi:hypothetical protein
MKSSITIPLPRYMKVKLSTQEFARQVADGELQKVFELDDTDGFPCSFVAEYRLIRVRRVLRKRRARG